MHSTTSTYALHHKHTQKYEKNVTTFSHTKIQEKYRKQTKTNKYKFAPLHHSPRMLKTVGVSLQMEES
jgi:hypothetical protein